ncbi:MAG TPA: glycosyltransferase family 1 protein [Thermoanaerobaculia bacterium]|nr:glycosyltransferase family 1 protein [Thermoanaerobaculia bacterium]
MRIGISALYRMNGGSLTHLRHLLKVWAEDGIDREHDVVLFVQESSAEALRPSLSPNMQMRVIGGQSFNPVVKLLWEQLRFGKVLRDERIDVLFCTANIIPLFTRTPIVLALRNAGPFCDSMTVRNVGFYLWAYMKLTGLLMRISTARATRVIFISQYFRGIFEQLGFDARRRSDVIYHGRDAGKLAGANVPAVADPPKRAMLFVGNLYRYKNVAELIEAYAVERDYFIAQELKLVIVGNPLDVDYAARLHETVTRHGLEEHVVFTGGVTHEQILAWMAHCELFVFQSTCENCPNTLIEALAAGLPIACSNSGVMPEIAGDAAVYYDPFDPRDIARALRRVVSDPALQDTLRERARAQALKFPTWQDVGRRTLETLRHAADDGSRP